MTVKSVLVRPQGLAPPATPLAVNGMLLLLSHLFFTSNSVVFVDEVRKNISCPRAQGTLATPLLYCIVSDQSNSHFFIECA